MNRAVEQELMNCPIGMVHEDYRRLLGSRGSLVGAGPRTHDRVALRTSALHDRTWRHAVPTMSSAKKVTSSFIEQLLCMLDDAEIQDFEDIIGWLPEGIAFKVLIIKDFEELILPHYLNQTKMRSFQRQVRMIYLLFVRLGKQLGIPPIIDSCSMRLCSPASLSMILLLRDSWSSMAFSGCKEVRQEERTHIQSS